MISAAMVSAPWKAISSSKVSAILCAMTAPSAVPKGLR
jgi:hypothetical protein